MSITFYLARHAQSFGNIGGDITGSNPELTPLGMQQAINLAKKFQEIPLTAIYASTLIRAQQTAKPVAKQKNLPVQITASLRERFFGSLEGMTGLEVQKNHGERYRAFDDATFDDQMSWKLVDDEETFGEVIARVNEFLNSFTDTQQEQHILLVSHANVLVPMLVHLGFANFGELPHGSVTNTGFITIAKSETGIQLLSVDGISKRTT